jgi:hypothetical protein
VIALHRLVSIVQAGLLNMLYHYVEYHSLGQLVLYLTKDLGAIQIDVDFALVLRSLCTMQLLQRDIH